MHVIQVKKKKVAVVVCFDFLSFARKGGQMVLKQAFYKLSVLFTELCLTRVPQGIATKQHPH